MYRTLFIVFISTFGVVSSDASYFSKSNCDLKNGSKCIVYIDESVNWNTAEDCCVAWGGHLASIHSEEENNLLNSLRNRSTFTWIGLRNTTGNMNFEWIDGTPYDFNNFGSNDPSEDGDCCHIYNQGREEETWNVYGCDNTRFGDAINISYSYFCQRNEPIEMLTTDTVTATSIRLEWFHLHTSDQNGALVEYNISYRGQMFDTITQYFIINRTIMSAPVTVNITELQEYTNYSIKICSIDEVVEANKFSVEISQMTESAAPSTPPLSISVSSMNSSALMVVWSPPIPIHHNGILTEYQIQYYEIQNATKITINVHAETLIKIVSDLNSNVKYCVTIRVATIAGFSNVSSPICAKTLEADTLIMIVNNIKNGLEMLMEKLGNDESISEKDTQQSIAIIGALMDSIIGNDSLEDEVESEILQIAVMIIKLMIEKGNETLSDQTAQTIVNLLSRIVERDHILEDQNQTELISEEQSAVVAIASTLLASTLNTIEELSIRLSEEQDRNSNTRDVLIINSELITIIVQTIKIADTANISEITLPKRTSSDEDYSILLQLPIENIDSLYNSSIATAIVKNVIRNLTSSNIPVQRSDIFVTTLPGKSAHLNLEKKITLSFDVHSTTPSGSICVFLNSTIWVSGDITTIEKSPHLTNCISPHLTSFAVFTTPRSLGGSDDLQKVFLIFRYITVSISFLALLLSLILFIYTGKSFFKVEANIVYFNYCLSLTLAFGMFLFGIEAGTFNGFVCTAIAFLLHYTFLTVFAWALCNGILILYKLTWGIWNKHKIYIYLILFGWCFPIIIPIITMAMKHEKYVNTDVQCFLTSEDGIIWAFIGPIIFILLINIIILIIAVVRISTTKFGSERLQERQVIKNALISSIILTPILGIPWILLLLNILIFNPITKWFFSLTNGLMGVFYFFAVTIRNEQVKEKFRKSKIYNVEYMPNALFNNKKPTGACNKFHSTTSSSSYSNSDSSRRAPIQSVNQRPNNDLPKFLPRAIKPNKKIDNQDRKSNDDTSCPKKEPFETLTPKDEVYSNL